MFLKRKTLKGMIDAAREAVRESWQKNRSKNRFPARKVVKRVRAVGVKNKNICKFIVLCIYILKWIMSIACWAARKLWRGITDAACWVAGKLGQKSAPEDHLPVQEVMKRGKAAGGKNKTVAVVPVYNHGESVGDVVATLRGYGLPVILVDDGSDMFTARILDEIASMKSTFGPPVKLVRLPKNRGKGAAVMTGFRSAYTYGISHVLQVDADGQHGLEVVPRFLGASAQNPDAVIAGYPLYDATVPFIRLYGSRLNLVWVWINTLSRRITGPMCGFRLYPLAKVKEILPAMARARRMDFDTEIAVRLDWENVSFVNLPVAVRYPLGGFSHFRLIRDSLLIVLMHVRLFFGMIRRSPKLLSRHSGLFARYSGLLSRRFQPDHDADASSSILDKGGSFLGRKTRGRRKETRN